jgi:hypothetical protein
MLRRVSCKTASLVNKKKEILALVDASVGNRAKGVEFAVTSPCTASWVLLVGSLGRTEPLDLRTLRQSFP